jgi:cytochrome c-type biogenesis protein CcmH
MSTMVNRGISAVLPTAACAAARLAALLAALLIGSAPAAATVFEQRDFANVTDERRYKAMIEELRCLVCQNQNIAASDADLARDLRDRVYGMINEGRSDQEIVDFMVQRYGDFVLYRPPLGPATLLLWGGPFVLGVLAVLLLLRRVRQHGVIAETVPALTPEERERALGLLEGGPADAPPEATPHRNAP